MDDDNLKSKKSLLLRKNLWERDLQRILTGKKNPRQKYFEFNIPKDRYFFTPEEVGRMLLFSPQTVWRWCRLGLIPSVRVGRFYRVLAEDLLELLCNRQVLKNR